jgi:hypothetical protein
MHRWGIVKWVFQRLAKSLCQRCQFIPRWECISFSRSMDILYIIECLINNINLLSLESYCQRQRCLHTVFYLRKSPWFPGNLPRAYRVNSLQKMKTSELTVRLQYLHFKKCSQEGGTGHWRREQRGRGKRRRETLSPTTIPLTVQLTMTVDAKMWNTYFINIRIVMLANTIPYFSIYIYQSPGDEYNVTSLETRSV